MDESQPASSRASVSDDPTRCDEDEIGALLRNALADTRSESVVIERWNGLAERIVADLQRQMVLAEIDVGLSETRRSELLLRSSLALVPRLR